MYKNDISSYKSLYALYMCIIEYIVLNIAELHFVSLSYVLQLIFDGKLDSIDLRYAWKCLSRDMKTTSIWLRDIDI